VPTPKSLHPNLARIAATYDEIFRRYANGAISAAKARSEIAALVARDDEGTSWSIDPDSGDWLRRSRSGKLVKAEPPSFGLVTPTAHDVSPGRAFNPDTEIDFHKVEDELLYSPSQYAGSTRVPRQPLPAPYENWFSRLIHRLARR
jgi:hypothetical protein